MGVFSRCINTNNFDYNENDYFMNESYTTNTDMCIALLESRENEYAVLEAGIKMDVIGAMHEGVERYIINEATASGILGKIKEILTKLLEKIKSIFHAFMAKINSFFMDSDKFFKKYSSDIAKKDFKDFEIKARKCKMERFEKLMAYTTDNVKTGIITKITDGSGTDVTVNWTDKNIVDKITESDFISNKVIHDVFDDDLIKEASLDEDSDIAKEIEDFIFEDPETHDDLRSTDILTSDWIGGLLNRKKFITDIEKQNKKCEKKLANLIRNIDKDLTKVAKAIGTKDGSYSSSSHEVKYESYSYNEIKYMEEKYETLFEKLYTINEAKNKNIKTFYTNDMGYLNYQYNLLRDSTKQLLEKYKQELKDGIIKIDASFSKTESDKISSATIGIEKILNAYNNKKNSIDIKETQYNNASDLLRDTDLISRIDTTLKNYDSNKSTGSGPNNNNTGSGPNNNNTGSGPNNNTGSGPNNNNSSSSSKSLGITVTDLADPKDKTQLDKAIKSISWLNSYFSKFQEYIIKGQNARLSCAKKAMAQARKIFAAAVAYNPKKENYDLYTAVGESVEFESIMYME